MTRPAQLVLFGASGDLVERKLVPALLASFAAGDLPETLQVIGVSRSERTSEQWRADLAEAVSPDLRDAWVRFSELWHWVRCDASIPAEVLRLKAELDGLIESIDGCRIRSGRLFYLALRPRLFGPVVASLAHASLLECPPGAKEGWRRVIVEKPFGTDLATARALNAELRTHLREDQLFRIDHYLGKETVQNIIALRFQNAIFEPLWSRKHVESVEVSVCETVAMEGGRAAYYDGAGAMRDMVQNHLLQVMALIAMEAPGSLDADAVRNEKVKVLQALRPFNAQRVVRDAVRAQYVAGPARDKSYLDEGGVADGSATETYVALRAMVDNWRWSGVPFLLRTGKAMHRRYTEVVLRFRTPPIDLLNGPLPDDVCALRPNALHLQIQPHETLRLSFLVKRPGSGFVLVPSELDFDYSDLGNGRTPPAYQRLLVDALAGNATLFIRGDEVEAAWSFVDGIRAGWAEANPPVLTYPAGSTGPLEADDLFRGCEGVWTS